MDIASINATDMAALTAQGYSESDLGMLAESEIKALLFVERDDNDSGTDPHDAAAAEQDAAAATPAAATTAAPAAAAEPEEAPEPVGLAVQFKAEVPADAAEQITTLKGEERAAFKRLMDGEIDSDEYQAVRDRTETAVDELKTKVMQASIFEQANAQAAEQTARNEWTRAEAAAFTTFKEEGLDYKGKPSLLAAYNVNLKALGADPKNERRDAQWFLTEAHKLTKADLGIVTKPRAASSSTLDLSEIPPTLRAVPVSGHGAVNSDEFAHMRNLSGLALEKAHAALTEAQRDRWMAE